MSTRWGLYPNGECRFRGPRLYSVYQLQNRVRTRNVRRGEVLVLLVGVRKRGRTAVKEINGLEYVDTLISARKQRTT